MPEVGVEIAAGDAPARAIDWMEVLADRPAEVPRVVELGVLRQRAFGQFPAEEPRGVGRVVLRISSTRQVADDPAASVGAFSGVAPLQPKLGLPYAGRAGDHGQRARNQPSAQVAIERVDAEGLTIR